MGETMAHDILRTRRLLLRLLAIVALSMLAVYEARAQTKPLPKIDSVCVQFLERGHEKTDSLGYFVKIDGQKEAEIWIPKEKDRKDIIWEEWYYFVYVGKKLAGIHFIWFHKKCPPLQRA
ncbi:MAG: hypothetical protein JWN50_795 [Parcubacteria group bacterium]|nr:hypothetical protein [Parcubacteria group bacterium]